MRRKAPLPARLGVAFRVSDAAGHGVSRWRRDASDLHRPFPGIRSTAVPETFLARVECYALRLRPGHRFCGVTAARLWGLPVPWFWQPSECLELAVPRGAAPPRPVAVRGRRLDGERGETQVLSGLPLLDPVSALFTMAAELTIDEAVIMIDAILSDSAAYPGLRAGRPLATMSEIMTALTRWGRFPGVRIIREALGRSREHVESPKETETRLAIVDAGLPEPVVQHVVRDGARRIAKVDLAYPELRIAIEYEGDGHRTSRDQWREDIRRQRELAALGWTVIRVTERDLADDRGSFVALLRRALAL